ncbi:selection and upkeep of intraepithelial T-cells protein 1-like isoform X2 [Acipenser oxyrinchus oxyrinchus]|uniref:Selection and upkeep of intraepithelial T-cells protein 1-like isoform X2 n=1 Tax=Acipenser oxyrinchus oxyrinchus TaxID=40147 RepID=A0AAD8G130_ACIOX|nr:selection and upkeep of intraepithelial T-cells protein 1-like isoform X2 [Acipenser oxyrinchus oxyrinchus]
MVSNITTKPEMSLLECLIVLTVLHICPLHAAIGSTPVISLVEDTRYGFKVSCVSRGWYPKPDLQWTDGRGAVLTAESETREEQDREGLYTVRSYLRTPEPEGGQVSCVIKYGKDQGELRSSAKIIGQSIPSLPGWHASAWGSGDVAAGGITKLDLCAWFELMLKTPITTTPSRSTEFPPAVGSALSGMQSERKIKRCRRGLGKAL